jgi:hypothetical protein
MAQHVSDRCQAVLYVVIDLAGQITDRCPPLDLA